MNSINHQLNPERSNHYKYTPNSDRSLTNLFVWLSGYTNTPPANLSSIQDEFMKDKSSWKKVTKKYLHVYLYPGLYADDRINPLVHNSLTSKENRI